MSSDHRDALGGLDPLQEGPWSHLPPPEPPQDAGPADAPPTAPRPPQDAAPPATQPSASDSRAARDIAWNARRAKEIKRAKPRPRRQPPTGRARLRTAPRAAAGAHTTSAPAGCFFTVFAAGVIGLATILTIAYVGMWITGDLRFVSAARAAACSSVALWLSVLAILDGEKSRLVRVVLLILGLLFALGSFVAGAL